MRILLDTHIFLWFISGDGQLSTNVRDAIRDPDNMRQRGIIDGLTTDRHFEQEGFVRLLPPAS